MNKLKLLLTPVLLAVVLGLPSPAAALVNPNFTVVDLKAASTAVWRLKVSGPADSKLTARVEEVLDGKADAKATTLVLDFSRSDLSKQDVQSAIGSGGSALGVMFIRDQENEDGDVVASLQIGTTWMGLIRTGDNTWDLVTDPDDLETTWAGTAHQLVRAVRYVLSDRSADFPVESGLSWRTSHNLGTLKGAAHGTLAIADGVVILSEGGDRVIQPGKKGAGPVDITAKLGLSSASRAMAAGDFNADGKVDLVSWDGRRLRLVLRKSDGTFAAPTEGLELAACRSLLSLGDVLLVADDKGIAVATPAKTELTLSRRAAPADAGKLGAAGPALAADFNDDGQPDVLHVYEKGLVVYPGVEGPDRLGKPAVDVVDVLKGPAGLTSGDFDRDGSLDVLVVGQAGATMLRHDKTWRATTEETGELAAAFMPGRTQAKASSACTSDLRGDGRQTVAIFSPVEAPGLFYARGFGCFAIAISLTRAEESVDGYDALSHGQQAGTLTDLDGDLAPDLLGVDVKGNVWAVLTEPDRIRRFAVSVTGPASTGPLTVKVSQNDRLLGMHLIRPGEPATLALPRAGKVALTWKTPSGKTTTKTLTVARPVDLGPLIPDAPEGK